MTEAEVKFILGRLRIVKCIKQETQQTINDKLNDIAFLRSETLGQVASRSDTSKIENAVKMAEILVGRYAKIVTECEQAEKQAFDLLALIKDESELYQVLFMRFIEGLTIEVASEKMYVSVRTLWTYSQRAISLICSRS